TPPPRRTSPRVCCRGGWVLCISPRARIAVAAAGDPFIAAGVCEYRITEFVATKTAPELAHHRQTLS
ncbi:hypothetical protein ACFW7O_27535, partial [Streptomyces diastatochromogenes]